MVHADFDEVLDALTHRGILAQVEQGLHEVDGAPVGDLTVGLVGRRLQHVDVDLLALGFAKGNHFGIVESDFENGKLAFSIVPTLEESINGKLVIAIELEARFDRVDDDLEAVDVLDDKARKVERLDDVVPVEARVQVLDGLGQDISAPRVWQLALLDLAPQDLRDERRVRRQPAEGAAHDEEGPGDCWRIDGRANLKYFLAIGN